MKKSSKQQAADMDNVAGAGSAELYSKDDVSYFSLEMRCCYFIAPFNKKIFPKSVDEWAENVGYLKYETDGCFYPKSKKMATDEVERLKSFVSDIVRVSYWC